MLTTKQLQGRIKTIKGSSSKLSEQIHVAAVGCLQHMQPDNGGNFTVATQLHMAVSPAYQNHLKRWFAAFGPIQWSKKEGQFRKDKRDNATPFDIEGAEKTSVDALATVTNAAETEFDATKMMKQVRGYLERRAVVAAEAGDSKVANELIAMAGESSEFHGKPKLKRDAKVAEAIAALAA